VATELFWWAARLFFAKNDNLINLKYEKKTDFKNQPYLLQNIKKQQDKLTLTQLRVLTLQNKYSKICSVGHKFFFITPWWGVMLPTLRTTEVFLNRWAVDNFQWASNLVILLSFTTKLHI